MSADSRFRAAVDTPVHAPALTRPCPVHCAALTHCARAPRARSPDAPNASAIPRARAQRSARGLRPVHCRAAHRAAPASARPHAALRPDVRRFEIQAALDADLHASASRTSGTVRTLDSAHITWGGRRRGAGRRPKGDRAGVSHAPRERLTGREPVLVTLKVKREVWSLRARAAFTRVATSLARARDRFGMRIVHFSVQRDHVHLIVEALERGSVSRGIKGLCVRVARALNRLMGRRGAVFADRYHDRVLTTPRQVRNALAYVICNARKHGLAPRSRTWLDPCSSARAFSGWSCPIELAATPCAVEPRTWLLTIGWRRAGGSIDPDHHPGPTPD